MGVDQLGSERRGTEAKAGRHLRRRAVKGGMRTDRKRGRRMGGEREEEEEDSMRWMTWREENERDVKE